jgi:hypothetical protein
MASPLYSEYIDNEKAEENEIDIKDFAAMDKLLDNFFESDLHNDKKCFHLTSILQLTGFRYQNYHKGHPRIFKKIVEFLKEPKSIEDMEQGKKLPPTLR